MSDRSPAVFLSYASQDAEAARRICEALRTAGVEVWFDQSELRGGDAWDAKIRKQIKECALFVPVISANTQARAEGYFRREWKLAVERTHDMADHVAFLMPVVIDDTRDADAFVPEKFREVQWTRLPGGETTSAFCPRVRDLLQPSGSNQTHSGPADKSASAPARTPWRRGLWLVVTGMAILGAGIFVLTKRDSTPIATVTGPRAEARDLVTKAWVQLNRTELYRGELEIADNFLKRASELAPDDAEIWAAWAHVDAWYVYLNLDATPARRDSARLKAAKALKLDPRSFEARLADACYIVRATGAQPGLGFAGDFLPAAERTLHELIRERPEDHRPSFALGLLLRNAGRYEESAVEFDRMALMPGRAATALSEKGWMFLLSGDLAAALEAANRSIEAQPFFGNLLLRQQLALLWTGDLEGAKAAAAQIPRAVLTEDVFLTSTVALFRFRREPEEMLRILNATPRTWLSGQGNNAPKHFMVAQAHQMAGRTEAAQLAWREALKLIEERLIPIPDSAPLLVLKARTLWALGRRDEAREVARLAESFGGREDLNLLIELGETDRAFANLQRGIDPGQSGSRGSLRWADLKLNPRYDPLRADPRFQALLLQAETDPKKNPHAGLKPGGSPAAKSVAVLAFDNLSDDPANEYFSDGISEELINALGGVPGLTVKGRTSSFFFKGNKNVSSAEIGRQLGVGYLVRGGVRKAGGKVRITAQLTRATTDEIIWRLEPVEGKVEDAFAVQQEIAALIAQNLQLKLGADAHPTRPVNPEALRLVLEGRYFWNQRAPAALERAEALFKQAIALDPQFASPHAGLADVYQIRMSNLNNAGDTTAAGREMRLARTAAQQAKSLDPLLAEAYATLGYVTVWDGTYAESARLLRRALELNPNLANAHRYYSYTLAGQGRLDAALEESVRAMDLDPLALANALALVAPLNRAHRYAEALKFAEIAVRLQVNDAPQGHWGRSEALWGLGRRSEAAEEARFILRQETRGQGDSVAIWILHQAGFTAEAAGFARELETKLTAGNYLRGFNLAAMGQHDAAFPLLARTPRGGPQNYLYYSPMFDALRSDPRFGRLLEQLDCAAEYQLGRETLARMVQEPQAKK